MKKVTVILACSAAIYFALPSHRSRAAGPPTNATAEEIFKWADKNGDGKVTPDELPNAGTFAKFDTNKDGVITLDEARPVLEAMIAEKKRLDGGSVAKGDGPLRRRLGDLVQKFIDKRTWPSTPSTPPAAPSAGAEEKPVLIGAKPIKPGDVGVGRQVADLAFKTLDGKSHKLSEWSGKRGVAFAFTSTTCPVSKRYAPSLARIEKELASRGVALVLVNPFASEKAEDIAVQAKELSFTAPYVLDADKAVANALGARTTTEVFLVDAKRTLIYRGALDDQYGVSYNLDAPRENYLLDAVNAMASGARPKIAATEAPGCELDVPSAKTAGTQVTFHRDVARILQQNCAQCHHDKGIAPFALDDVAEVTDRAKTIKRVVESRTMPPWSAAPIPDGQPNPWANDHSLSTRDKADLFAWLDSKDRPVGNPSDAPAPLKFTSEWSIGKPDLVVQIRQPIAVKAEGFMPYQVALVATTLTEDRWVQGYEIMPTAREVVHHVIVQVHEKGARIGRGEGGDSGYWAAYVPGNSARIYPDGFARKLPAGATISFQIHYTPNGKATEDQLRMGLVFAKEPPRFAMHTAAVAGHKLNIPPGEANHVETAQHAAPFDMNVTAFVAHMHVRGKSFRYELISADGRTETLLDIPHYDFNWQLRYELKEPRVIPRGSTVKVTAVFDNSPGNKANPDPTKTVRWGQQTYDEMLIGYIEYFTPLPTALSAR
ncbi:MAG: redoxin domain-containing protein [Chthoniobacteraceae bacterium]